MDQLKIKLAKSTDVQDIENIIKQAYQKYLNMIPQKPEAIIDDYTEVVRAGSTFIGWRATKRLP